jgi:hypothetical protein
MSEKANCRHRYPRSWRLSPSSASASPVTVAGVKEIISFLSARGNPAFLDLDDGL